MLLVQGGTEEILKSRHSGDRHQANVKLADPESGERFRMVEMIILPQSPLIGRTLKGQRFREHVRTPGARLNRHGER